MAQIKILLPLVALALGGCATVTTQPSAVEMAAGATRASTTFQSTCAGAQKTTVCTKGGSCRCADSSSLIQTLGLDDPAWLSQ